jgi:hypothetical protein
MIIIAFYLKVKFHSFIIILSSDLFVHRMTTRSPVAQVEVAVYVLTCFGEIEGILRFAVTNWTKHPKSAVFDANGE